MINNAKIAEEDLIVLLNNKDEQSFNYLYDNYSGALYGMVLRVVRFPEEASDVLQEVFVKIWKNIGSFNSEKGKLYTWMANIAKNTAVDHLKSKNFQKDLKTQTLPDFVNDNMKLFTNQNEDFLGFKQIVDQLKGEFLDIIYLSYYMGYTQEEISTKLDIPLGTVKTRTRYAFVELRKLLNEFKEN